MWLLFLIGAVLSAVATATAAGVTASENKKAVQETNEANLQAVRETNAANVEQANIAYERSLPINQVRNLTAAGMSKSAALQSLVGGGTYQMPSLQAGSSQAAQVDYSQIGQAFERLSNIPSNVVQNNMLQEQMKAVQIENDLKIANEKRALEQHEFDMWQKRYGKDAALKLDSLSSRIVQMAADKGINLDSIDTLDKLVNTFKLGNDPDYRDMPRIARNQLFDSVRIQAAENRAVESSNDTHTAAFDKHQIDELDKALKKSDLSAPDRDKFLRLAKFYAELEKDYDAHSIAKGQVKEKDLQNALTAAGFDSTVDAINAKNAAEAAAARYEKESTDFHGSRPQILKRIVWALDKLNPLNGLFKISKQN